MNQNCSKCNAPVIQGSKFCRVCGNQHGVASAIQHVTPSNPSLQNSRKKHVLPFVLIAIVVVAILFFAISRLYPISSRRSNQTLNKNGSHQEVKLSAGKSARIGNAAKDGWEVNVPKGVFDTDVTLSMSILPERDSKVSLPIGEVVGSFMEISASDGDDQIVYLPKPVSLTMIVPENQSSSIENSNLIGAMKVDGEWFYCFPTNQDLDQRLITFETDHFTPFALIRVKDKELVKLIAKDMVRREWEQGKAKEQIISRLDTTIRDKLSELGCADKRVQDKMILNIKLNPKFDRLLSDIEDKETVDIEKVGTELAQDGFISSYLLFPGATLVPGAKTGVDLRKSALEYSRGNYGTALKHIAVGTIRLVGGIKTKMATAAVESVQLMNAIMSDYERFSSNVGFHGYVNRVMNDGGSYDITSYEWEQMLKNIYGSVENAKIAFLKEEAESLGVSWKDLQKDTKKVDDIYQSYSDDLNQTFIDRYKLEKTLKDKQTEYEKIAQQFIDLGYYTSGRNGFDIGMTIKQRTQSLFAARNYILELFDGKMPVLNMGESSEDNLNQATIMYILCRGDTGKFFEWLLEKGYIKATDEPTSTPPPEPETSASPVPTPTSTPIPEPTPSETLSPANGEGYRSRDKDLGIYLFAMKYTISGGRLENAEETDWHITLSGTVHKGETVSIEFWGNTPPQDPQMQAKGGRVTTAIVTDPRTEKDKAYEAYENIVLNPGESAASIISYVVPDNVSEITIGGTVERKWVNMNGGFSRTASVTVVYKVID